LVLFLFLFSKLEYMNPFTTRDIIPLNPLVSQIRPILANINMLNIWVLTIHYIKARSMKTCKISLVSQNPRNAINWVQFRFNSTGDITGDIIFQQVIYRQLRIDKFKRQFINPVIPAIPGYYTYFLYSDSYYVCFLLSL
jgi:hypothetical protein